MRVAATLALVFAAACGPRLPPALTPLSLPQPTIEAAPQLDDASLFGFLRLRKLPEMLQRLGINGVDKMTASMGVALDDFSADAPLGFYLWDPGDGGPANMPVAALLPMPPQAPLPSHLKLILGANKVLPAPGGTLLALTPQGLTRAQSELAALAKLTASPMSAHLQLHLWMVAIRARYGAQIDEFFDKAAKEPSKTVGDNANVKRFNEKMFVEMKKWFTDLASMTLEVTADNEFVDASAILRDAAPAPAAAPGALPSADLASFLPDGQVRFEFDGGHVRGWMTSFVTGVYGILLENSPVLRERMNRWVTAWADASINSRFGCTMSLTEKGMSGVALIASPKAAQMMTLLEEGYALLEEAPVQKGLRELGSEITVEAKKNVRQIQGWPVDYYHYSTKYTSQLPAETKAMMSKLGSTAFEIVRMGDFVLYTVNGKPGELEALAADLLAGTRHGRPLQAKKDFPTGGFFHADLDAASMYESFRLLVPEPQKLPHLAPGAPLITMFGYSGGGASQYRMRVPQGLISSVRGAVK